MKSLKILVPTIIYSLIINTTYYWEGKLGVFALPIFLLLFILYLALVVVLLRQVFLIINERSSNKIRVLTTGILLVVLISTFVKPTGIIDFDKLEGENILIAESEGVANCTTVLKLKDNFTFKERSVCFGVTEIKGSYHFRSDTIFFENLDFGRYKTEFYQFAIIAPSEFDNGNHLNLIKYKNVDDTIGRNLWITKNELSTLKTVKVNR